MTLTVHLLMEGDVISSLRRAALEGRSRPLDTAAALKANGG